MKTQNSSESTSPKLKGGTDPEQMKRIKAELAKDQLREQEKADYVANSTGRKSRVHRVRLETTNELRADSVWFDINNLIQTGGKHVINASPGCGKTTIAVDISQRLARGLDLTAKHRVEAPCFVTYLTGESFEGLGQRLRAWELFHNEKSSPNLLIANGAFDITNPVTRNEWKFEYQETLLKYIDRVRAKDPDARFGDFNVLIIDPLAAFTGDMDENSTRDMKNIVESIDDLCSDELDGAVIVIHHGASKPRGSTVLPAWADAVYSVADRQTHFLFTQTKIRNFEMPPLSWEKAFQNVENSSDWCGQKDVIVAVPKIPTSSSGAKSANLAPESQRTKRAITVQLFPLLQSLCGPDNTPVQIAVWRAEAIEKGFVSEHRQAFHRAKKKLIDDGKIIEHSDESVNIAPSTKRQLTAVK